MKHAEGLSLAEPGGISLSEMVPAKASGICTWSSQKGEKRCVWGLELWSVTETLKRKKDVGWNGQVRGKNLVKEGKGTCSN